MEINGIFLLWYHHPNGLFVFRLYGSRAEISRLCCWFNNMTLIINQFLCLNRNLRFFVGIFDHFNHIYVDWRKQNRFIDYLFVNEACYLMAICFCQTNGKNNERGLDWFTKLLSTTLCSVDRVYQVFWSLLTEQCKMINEKKPFWLLVHISFLR